jgi:capsular polysaccharide biosynthesis protein
LQEQPLDVRAGIDIIKRRRVMVVAVGAVGLMAGILYWAAHPTMPSATAQVLLPTSTSATAAATGSPSTDTQKVVAISPSVLGPATKSVTPPISESLLRKRVSVAGVGSNVLSITVKSPHPAAAVKLANGVAKQYVAVSPQYFAASLESALQNNQQQEAQDQAKIQELIKDLNQNSTASAAGAYDQGMIQTLANQVAADQATDSITKGQIVTNSPVMLQEASSVNPVSRLAGPEDAVGGLIVGLAIGSIVALWKGRRDRRLRRRDDLARSLGLPVLASLDAERCERAEDWNLLLDTYQPGTVDAWSLRRLLRQLDASDSGAPVGLQIVSYADDETALSVGVQMASFAAGMGISTTLLAGDHYAIETLRAACAISAQAPPPEALLSFVRPDAADSSTPRSHLTITVAAVDQRRPHFEMTGRDLVLIALSAGVATSDDLARLALAAADAGTNLDGIIVVNPDDHDYTTGELPARAFGLSTVPRMSEDPLPSAAVDAQDEP